jgi:hypothetical protein
VKGQVQPSSGKLDVDMNAGGGETREGVENIIYTDINKIQEGEHQLLVHQYAQRETENPGFDVELEFDNIIHSFHYSQIVRDFVPVVNYTFSKKDGFKITKTHIPSTHASKEIWGIATQQFRKVSMVMNSPNHWDGNQTGNKHYFFMLDECRNPEKARGFFNEFLKEELREHRKVFEVLGSKMKTERSEDQLSGLGFSSTQRNSVFCKVSGSFARTIKINF